MSNHRIYHPERAATSSERSKRYRHNKKKKAEQEKNRVRHVSTVLDVRHALVQMANAEELKTLYRSIAQRLHSDHGGDDKQMAKLNRLWTRLTKEKSDFIMRNEIGEVPDGVLMKPATVTPKPVTNPFADTKFDEHGNYIPPKEEEATA
jgi:hypothetical protein